MIENEFFQIGAFGTTESGATRMTHFNKRSNEIQELAFSLKNYNPSSGREDLPNSDNDPSGAYIFKPKINDQAKHAYSVQDHVDKWTGANTGVQILTIYYTDEDNQKSYTAVAQVIPGAQTVKWQVDLHGIPLIRRKGMEVVVNWELNNFVNDGVFYTDSNGLEMQKRVVDFREDFTLETDEHVSANYYPINSSIVIRRSDGTKQFTVMNDRSQGGSSLADGSIELMQNRRLTQDDWRGVGEALNEVNKLGVGIEVDATYYTSFTDLASGQKSAQRDLQLAIDEPVQMFVAMSGEVIDALASVKDFKMQSFDQFDGNLKIVLWPEDINQILIRVENIADLFDGTPEETPQFDLKSYAMQLYEMANTGDSAKSISIEERTLSNNEAYEDMVKSRFAWKTADGDSSVVYPEDQEVNSVIALQPQRIRVYRVKYDQEPELFLY